MASISPLRLHHFRKNSLEMNSCYGDLPIGPPCLLCHNNCSCYMCEFHTSMFSLVPSSFPLMKLYVHIRNTVWREIFAGQNFHRFRCLPNICENRIYVLIQNFIHESSFLKPSVRILSCENFPLYGMYMYSPTCYLSISGTPYSFSEVLEISIDLCTSCTYVS